jgi:PAS domain S-box-containing protein
MLPWLFPWAGREQLVWLETYKGWFFVAVTAVVLYILLRRRLGVVIRSREALRASQQQYRVLFTEMLSGFALHEIICDERGRPCDYRFLDINPAFETITGMSRQQVVGKTVRQVFPGVEQEWIEKYGAVALTGNPAHFESYLHDLDKHFEVIAYSPGRGRFAVTFTDVTQRKRAENELAERTRLNRILLDAFPCVALLMRPGTREIVISNKAAGAVGAIPCAQCFSTWGQRQDPCPWCLAPKAWATKEPQRLEVEALDTVWDAHWIPVSDDLYMHFAMDITERKRAEQALRESEERYRLIFETAANLINSVDEHGVLVDCNIQIKAVLGYERDEVIGVSIARFIHPDDLAKVMGVLREIIDQGQSTGNEWRMIRKDGAVIDVRVNSTSIRDAKGRFVRTICIIDDITEKKRLEQQLLQSQKMEAIGRLAGGVAHDFNNLLAVISGYCESLDRRLPPDSPLHVHAEEIAKAAERGASLIKQLLAFSRRQTVRPQVLDLNLIVSDLEEMLRRVISRNIAVSVELGRNLGPIRADRGQIEQIIMNLTLNARDAMNGVGKLSIRTADLEVDQDSATPFDVPAGRYVRLVVSDTGCGMDSELQGRIFEPFFTTKEGQGTGLGLSIVYGIVQQAGGSIHVRSKPGEGAVFEVLLPCVPAEAEAVGATPVLA